MKIVRNGKTGKNGERASRLYITQLLTPVNLSSRPRPQLGDALHLLPVAFREFYPHFAVQPVSVHPDFLTFFYYLTP